MLHQELPKTFPYRKHSPQVFKFSNRRTIWGDPFKKLDKCRIEERVLFHRCFRLCFY